MSVMACSRQGCNNIMCDRYSSIHGYICNDCYDELVQSGVETDIEKFMNEEKVEKPITESSDAFFNRVFPKNNEL